MRSPGGAGNLAGASAGVNTSTGPAYGDGAEAAEGGIDLLAAVFDCCAATESVPPQPASAHTQRIVTSRDPADVTSDPVHCPGAIARGPDVTVGTAWNRAFDSPPESVRLRWPDRWRGRERFCELATLRVVTPRAAPRTPPQYWSIPPSANPLSALRWGTFVYPL